MLNRYRHMYKPSRRLQAHYFLLQFMLCFFGFFFFFGQLALTYEKQKNVITFQSLLCLSKIKLPEYCSMYVYVSFHLLSNESYIFLSIYQTAMLVIESNLFFFPLVFVFYLVNVWVQILISVWPRSLHKRPYGMGHKHM